MSTNKRVTMCLTICLRDYAAFEDLAEELGVSVFDVKIEDKNGEEPVTRRRRAKPKIKVKMTPKLWDEIKTYPESMTYAAIARQMGKGGRSPIEVPSSQTISNIRRGKILRPSEESL